MSAHTPGPWYIGRAWGNRRIVAAEGAEIVRALSTHGARRLREEERAANRNLIAAGPKMLKALRLINEEMGKASSKGPSGRPGVAALNRMWEAVREAIAEAEGGAA